MLFHYENWLPDGKNPKDTHSEKEKHYSTLQFFLDQSKHTASEHTTSISLCSLGSYLKVAAQAGLSSHSTVHSSPVDRIGLLN